MMIVLAVLCRSHQIHKAILNMFPNSKLKYALGAPLLDTTIKISLQNDIQPRTEKNKSYLLYPLRQGSWHNSKGR